MAVFYMDTSAIAKRYVPETGSTWVQALCSAETITLSSLVIVEFATMPARRVREKSMSVTNRDAIQDQFDEDMTSYLLVDIDRSILDTAASLALSAPAIITLRALDSIHAATMRAVVTSAHTSGASRPVFVSADTRLLAAAQWAGFATDNPEVHP
ncbi:MAG: type II toxin-antitoxin system VapC family toxin [Chloroflexota bacterium]|nr:type II toxin-antitoxin system VapC family toxin [Chloroflexota bacterium]